MPTSQPEGYFLVTWSRPRAGYIEINVMWITQWMLVKKGEQRKIFLLGHLPFISPY
jgi:hypothetical protein